VISADRTSSKHDSVNISATGMGIQYAHYKQAVSEEGPSHAHLRTARHETRAAAANIAASDKTNASKHFKEEAKQ